MNSIQISKEKIYEVPTPFNVNRLLNDLEVVRKELSPGRFSEDALVDFIRELDCYIIDHCVPKEILMEVLKEAFNERKSVPDMEDIISYFYEYNYTLKTCMVEATICIDVDTNKVSMHDYVNNYEELVDEYLDFFYESDFVSYECLVYENNIYDQIKLSPSLDQSIYYFENSGMNDDGIKFIESLNLLDNEVEIYTNDCQEVLIPMLIEGGCVPLGNGEIGYYPKYINNRPDERLQLK